MQEVVDVRVFLRKEVVPASTVTKEEQVGNTEADCSSQKLAILLSNSAYDIVAKNCQILVIVLQFLKRRRGVSKKD